MTNKKISCIGKNKIFDYEETFMGVREKKPQQYRLYFNEDYRLRSLTKIVKIDKGRLLDIGCGGGVFTESLSYYYPNINIFGCDISKTAISYAKKLGAGNIKYRVINNGHFPYSDNFFDVCICLDVLEHVPDIFHFIKEIKRVLKKDGMLYLIVPCENQPYTCSWLLSKVHLWTNLTYRYYGHVHPEFTHKKVIKFLNKNGFKIDNIKYSEHFIYQFLRLLTFFVPKVLLEFVFGETITKAYSDSGVIRNHKNILDPLMMLRNWWYHLIHFLNKYPMYWETIILENIPITALKIHILSSKK